MQEFDNYSRKVSFSKEKLSFLSLIKFAAVVAIIYQHVLYSQYKGIDLGGRMVELLFVSSGFLVGYNYIDRNIKPRLKNSLSYVGKKLLAFYPLHIICMVLAIVLEFVIGLRKSVFEGKFFLSLILNVTLTQAWVFDKDAIYSFNGVSWFLSALLFCYFLSPFFIQGIKKFKLSIILLGVVIFVRIMFEFLVIKYAKSPFIQFHTNPIIKATDFFIGMLTVPMFSMIKQKLDDYKEKLWMKIIFTVVEVSIPISLIFIMYFGEGILLRGVFVTIFAFYVMLCALCSGYISRFCSSKEIQKIFSYQFEMYMFQAPVFYALHVLIIALDVWYVTENMGAQFIVKVLIIFVVAVIYKQLLDKPINKGLNCIINKTKSIFIKKPAKTT